MPSLVHPSQEIQRLSGLPRELHGSNSPTPADPGQTCLRLFMIVCL